MEKPSKTFAAFVLLGLVTAGALLLIPATHAYQMHMFFASGRDCLADFLNPLNSLSASGGFNPYHHWVVAQREMIYPPFAYAVLLPFAKFMPASGMDISTCHASPLAMAIGWLGTLLMASVLFAASLLFSRRHKVPVWLTFVLCCTGMVLGCIERGNQILLSTAGVLLFLGYYDVSEEQARFKKFLAAFGLALAASLKVTPVLFGVLWLNRRNLRWLVLSGGIAIVMTFVPLLWSDHSIVENVLQLHANVSANQEFYSQHSLAINPQILVCAAMVRLGFSECLRAPAVAVVRYGALFLGIACLVRATVGQSAAWKRFFMLAAGQVLIPAAPQGYVVLYFIPALLAYFAECPQLPEGESTAVCKRGRLVERTAFAVFLLLAIQVPLLVLEENNMNFAVHSLAITGLSLLLVAEPVAAKRDKDGTAGDLQQLFAVPRSGSGAPRLDCRRILLLGRRFVLVDV